MSRQPLGGLGRLIFRGFTITLFFRHTTFGRTSLDEGPARRRDLYLTTYNTHKKQTSMPPVGFFFCLSGFFFPLIHFCTVFLHPFVLHVTLRSTLPSLQQTQHKHPCPRWDFFLPVRGFSPLIHFFVLFKSFRPSCLFTFHTTVLTKNTTKTSMPRWDCFLFLFFLLIPGFSPLIHFCSVLILFRPFHVT
jgi:hypothetical protein